MARGTWKNNDGLYIRYGVEQGDRKDRSGVTASTTKDVELELLITLTGAARTIYTADLTNDGVLDGFSGLDTPIPANALIKSVDIINVETPAGGTNYALGTYQANGTVDTANGLKTTVGVDGAQVGTVLSAARYVTAVTTGTYTAGKVKVRIVYVTV